MKPRYLMVLTSALLGVVFMASLCLSAPGQSPPRGYSIPIIDLSHETTRQVIVDKEPGQYRVRLMDNTKDADCAYPGLDPLPDGTFVTTTYGHWTEGDPPLIVSVRFKMAELEARAEAQAKEAKRDILPDWLIDPSAYKARIIQDGPAGDVSLQPDLVHHRIAAGRVGSLGS